MSINDLLNITSYKLDNAHKVTVKKKGYILSTTQDHPQIGLLKSVKVQLNKIPWLQRSRLDN